MLTDVEYTKVKHTFDYVHSIFKHSSDPVFFEQHEYWEDPKFIVQQLETGEVFGNAKIFALVCRYILSKAKVPNRIVMCLTENGETHLVCEAEGWILDNRQTRLRTWGALPYKWIKISGYQLGEPWHEIAV